MDYTHIFEERGNGFPDDGEVVIVREDSGDRLDRIVRTSPIHTDSRGMGGANYVYVELAAENIDGDAYSDEEYESLPVVRPDEDR